MTCRQVIALMADYLAKDLDLDTAMSFEKHLSSCPDCPAFLNTYKRTIQMAQSLRYSDISHERASRLRRILDRRIHLSLIFHGAPV